MIIVIHHKKEKSSREETQDSFTLTIKRSVIIDIQMIILIQPLKRKSNRGELK